MNKGDFKPTREFQTLRSNIIAITKLGVKKFVFVKLPINLFKKLSKTVFTCPEEPRLNVLMERGNKSCDAVPLMFLITYEHSRTNKIYTVHLFYKSSLHMQSKYLFTVAFWNWWTLITIAVGICCPHVLQGLIHTVRCDNVG